VRIPMIFEKKTTPFKGTHRNKKTEKARIPVAR